MAVVGDLAMAAAAAATAAVVVVGSVAALLVVQVVMVAVAVAEMGVQSVGQKAAKAVRRVGLATMEVMAADDLVKVGSHDRKRISYTFLEGRKVAGSCTRCQPPL